MWKTCLLLVPFATGSTNVVVRDGYVIKADGSKGAFVGTTTSSLQTKVIDGMFEKVTPETWSSISIINETTLRTLDLQGQYTADEQLNLPSLFRLRLSGSITLKAGVSTSTRFAALVAINGSQYSAVLGGNYNASGDNGYSGISVVNSTACTVKGVHVSSDINGIVVHASQRNDIVGNDIGPGKFRGIWSLVAGRNTFRENHIHDCQGHALDFDAYTTNSLAYQNTVTGAAIAEGIFVEETATDNMVVGNTVSNNHNGIGVYSNVVGPVKGNMIVGNIATKNTRYGISSGGVGHEPFKHSDHNLFVGNQISGNAAPSNIHHGATQGDLWINNINSDGWGEDPHFSASVGVFDPGQAPKPTPAAVIV